MEHRESTGQSPPLSITCSRHFLPWLSESGISLGITTYQTNRLFLIGTKQNGSLSAFERLLDGAMGLYTAPDRLYLATKYQLWRFDNALQQGERHNGYDKLFIPRVGYTTGYLDMHDVVVDKQQRILFINTLYSCLATTHDRYSFTPLWKPTFISKLVPEDRCHLNGLAMVEGEPKFVTAISRSDVAAGWRQRRQQGGCVIDINSNEIITDALSMPHSPRFYNGKLWLLNSGTGELGYLDDNSGQFQAIAFCPGYLRGLAFYKNFAIVAMSKPRHSNVFSGLDLDKQLSNKDADPRCGISVIDIETGNTVHWFEFEGVVSELYDVQVIPDAKQPMALGFKSDEIKHNISFEDQGKTTLHTLLTGANVDPANAQQDVKVLQGKTNNYSYQVNHKLSLVQLIESYDTLTFPRLSKQQLTIKEQEPLISISAIHQGHVVGMAIAALDTVNKKARLVSLYVKPEHRQCGIATSLLSYTERIVTRSNIAQLDMTYRSDWRNVTAIKRLLAHQGWSKTEPWMMLCKGTMQGIASASWLHRFSLPEDAVIFPWSDLDEAEKNDILQRQSTDLHYLDELTPFQEPDRIETLNSLGLRYRGQVVGWMITHRITADTIQYTSLFVREDLQGSVYALVLLAEAIKRQMLSDVPNGICQVNVRTKRMINVIHRRLFPYEVTATEQHISFKILNARTAEKFEHSLA